MKKIFGVILCGILLFGITGCGSEEQNNNQLNSDNKTEEKQDNTNVKINNDSLENTVKEYYLTMYDEKDTKTAYQYYDYTGLYTWQMMGLGSYSVTADKLTNFISNYEQNKADTDLQNRIDTLLKETYTDSFYEELDEEVAHNQSNIVGNKKFEVEIEIKDQEEVVPGVYHVGLTMTYRFENGNGAGGDKRHVYLIENDGKYYIVNSAPRYDDEFHLS